MAERLLWEQEVEGSNPFAPINKGCAQGPSGPFFTHSLSAPPTSPSTSPEPNSLRFHRQRIGVYFKLLSLHETMVSRSKQGECPYRFPFILNGLAISPEASSAANDDGGIDEAEVEVIGYSKENFREILDNYARVKQAEMDKIDQITIAEMNIGIKQMIQAMAINFAVVAVMAVLSGVAITLTPLFALSTVAAEIVGLITTGSGLLVAKLMEWTRPAVDIPNLDENYPSEED